LGKKDAEIGISIPRMAPGRPPKLSAGREGPHARAVLRAGRASSGGLRRHRDFVGDFGRSARFRAEGIVPRRAGGTLRFAVSGALVPWPGVCVRSVGGAGGASGGFSGGTGGGGLVLQHRLRDAAAAGIGLVLLLDAGLAVGPGPDRAGLPGGGAALDGGRADVLRLAAQRRELVGSVIGERLFPTTLRSTRRRRACSTHQR